MGRRVPGARPAASRPDLRGGAYPLSRARGRRLDETLEGLQREMRYLDTHGTLPAPARAAPQMPPDGQGAAPPRRRA